MTNRRDIAKHANVSTATVSNVFNNTKYVSPEIRGRVLAAAKELNYSVNSRKGKYTSKTHEVVFVVNDATNPHHGKILEGMNETAQKHGYAVSMMMLGSNVDEFCRILIDRHIDAVFFSTYHHEITGRHLEQLKNGGVLVVRSWENFLIDFDNVLLKTVQHLAALGHRKIAYLSGLSVEDDSNVRYHAYCSAMEACGLEVDRNLVIDGIYPYETTVQSGYWAMKTRLDASLDFTAVIALNDLMAIGAMQAIHEKGLRIPDDISVVGCDDIPIAEFVNPALTTLRLPAKEMGNRTMYDIIQKIEHKETVPLHLVVDLIIRKSVGRAK